MHNTRDDWDWHTWELD